MSVIKIRNQNINSQFISEVESKLKSIKDPKLRLEQRSDYERRKYQELLQKISFLDQHLKAQDRRYDYPDDFRPFVFFYKFLARRPDAPDINNHQRLKLWLPDTILTSDGENGPMWLYSSQDGYVYRTDNFTAKNMINKLGSFSSPDELVAVLKKPQARDFAYVGNDIRLLTVKDVNAIAQNIVASKGEMICLQKFVKSIGPKAFICRTCWRRDKNSYVWVITNKKGFDSQTGTTPETQKYTTNPKAMNSCIIINSIKGRYLEETVPYVVNLVRYLENNISGAKFDEFIADFIKDESGTWWLINVRGFVLIDKIGVNPRFFLASPDEALSIPQNTRKKISDGYQKVTLCKYCELMYPNEDLPYKMTLKSIIQTDLHLLHRGKTFRWLDRSDGVQYDSAALYREHKVCVSCYKLHEEIEKLKQVEFNLAKVLGIPVNPDKRPDMVSVTSSIITQANMFLIQSGSLTQRGSTSDRIDEMRLGPKSARGLSEGRSSATIPDQLTIKSYRMLIYLHMLYDIPKDVDANKTYYIEYTLFEQKTKYKVDLNRAFSVNGSILIPVNRLRIFYFFSYERQTVTEYINEHKFIEMSLICDNERVGVATFELDNFFINENINRTQLFKVFSGKKLPILSWGLKITVGLCEGKSEDVRRIKLNKHNQIYLTTPEYYTCEALPEEWLQMFEENQENIKTLVNKSDLKSSRYSVNAHSQYFDSAKKLSIVTKRNSKRGSFSKRANSPFVHDDESRPVSAFRSLFENEEKTISGSRTKREVPEEEKEAYRRLLADSISDYEKNGRKLTKRASGKPPSHSISKPKKPETATLEKNHSRRWSGAIRPMKDEVFSA